MADFRKFEPAVEEAVAAVSKGGAARLGERLSEFVAGIFGSRERAVSQLVNAHLAGKTEGISGSIASVDVELGVGSSRKLYDSGNASSDAGRSGSDRPMLSQVSPYDKGAPSADPDWRERLGSIMQSATSRDASGNVRLRPEIVHFPEPPFDSYSAGRYFRAPQDGPGFHVSEAPTSLNSPRLSEMNRPRYNLSGLDLPRYRDPAMKPYRMPSDELTSISRRDLTLENLHDSQIPAEAAPKLGEF